MRHRHTPVAGTAFRPGASSRIPFAACRRRFIGTGSLWLWQDKREPKGGGMNTRAEPASKTLAVNGLRLHYLEWGKPGALPVICVHGYTSSAQAFNALARHL